MPTSTTITLDCSDAGKLADFYQRLTGWKLDGTTLSNGSIDIGFQELDGYQGPGWPGAEHIHFDFTVDDLTEATEHALALGATKPDFQPGGTEWIVLTDPDCHPFCLVA